MSLRRSLLSVFIVFHLFAIIVMPNRMSWLSKTAAPWMEPYLHLFEFTANWNFFAPEPGPPPLRLEWELLGERGEDLGEGRFPVVEENHFFTDRLNRRIAIARFMTLYPATYLKVWPDFVCRQTPRPHSLRLWRTVLDVPSATEVRTGAKDILNPSIADRESFGQVFCPEPEAS